VVAGEPEIQDMRPLRKDLFMTPDGRDFALAFSRALGKVVVHVHGALDAGTAQELKHRLVDVIEGQGNRQVVLDLRRTTSVDAAGLSVLVDALKCMQRNGGELVLNAPTTGVARAIRAAGLDRDFLVTPGWQHPSYGDGRGESDRASVRRAGADGTT